MNLFQLGHLLDMSKKWDELCRKTIKCYLHFGSKLETLNIENISTSLIIRVIPRQRLFQNSLLLSLDFLIIWIGNSIIYKNEEVATNILGVNQSLSTSFPSTMSIMERGDIAMGFNRNKIVHNFKSTPTGGEIVITALDTNDTETID